MSNLTAAGDRASQAFALESLSPVSFLPGLALALAIGVLIGVERGWRMRAEPPGGRVAGVRTFSILGLVGGLIGLVPTSSLALLVGVASLVAILLGYVADMRRNNNISATTTLAGAATLLLGSIAGAGLFALASVGAGITVALLASRERLHKAIGYTSEGDLKALIRLALVVFLILPLLPDANVGPFGGINPRRLWFIVVMVGSISFIGYGLTRWLGGRGSMITAAVGATVSSTAVTLESARRIREGSGEFSDQTAVAIASAVMLARVLVLVAMLAPMAFLGVVNLLWPALASSVVIAGAMALLHPDAVQTTTGAEIKAPGLGIAFLFAASVAILSLAASWAEQRFGSGSGAAVIAIGGMVDVDSAIAAIGALPADAISIRLTALAIAAPVAFNTLFKLALLVGVAGFSRTKWASVTLASTAAITIATALIAGSH